MSLIKEKLDAVFLELTNKVKPILIEVIDTDVSAEFRDAVDYAMVSGGKRLRPILTMASCLAGGGKADDALYPAAGLEILHNYSLIIDDIIDNGKLRRGKPTVWVKYGKAIAECLAIDYAASIFQAAVHAKCSNQITQIFAKTLKVLVEGEIRDIFFERQGRLRDSFVVQNRPKDISLEDYLLMVGQKTAALLSACCEVGALCAGVTNVRSLKAFKDYGYNLGIAFQIQDDILDMFGEEKKFGKKIGKDIEEHKGGNIILLYVMEEINNRERNRIRQIITQPKVSRHDIKEALEIIRHTQALDKALTLKGQYVQAAKNSLAVLTANKWTQILLDIADFVVQRES